MSVLEDFPTTLLDALSATSQTKKELAAKLGIPTRDVEALVQSYRVSGVAIYSDSDGYRYCVNSQEAEAMYRRLRQRIRSQGRTAWALRKAAKRLRMEEDRPLLLEPPPPIVDRERDLDWPAWR